MYFHQNNKKMYKIKYLHLSLIKILWEADSPIIMFISTVVFRNIDISYEYFTEPLTNS